MEDRTSGELILPDRRFRTLFLPLLASGGVTAAVMILVTPFLSDLSLDGYLPLDSGFQRGAVIALLTYILFRLLYPIAADRLIPHGGAVSVPWELTAEALILNGETIPRDSIRQVHIWDNRNALGQIQPGCIVNIERNGKNILLRSLTRGGEAEESAARLKAFAEALRKK